MFFAESRHFDFCQQQFLLSLSLYNIPVLRDTYIHTYFNIYIHILLLYEYIQIFFFFENKLFNIVSL